MDKDQGRVDTWLNAVAGFQGATYKGKKGLGSGRRSGDTAEVALLAEPELGVLSGYEFNDPCDPSKTIFAQIEPLVCHLR